MVGNSIIPITCKYVSSWDSNNGIVTGMGCATIEASTTDIETLPSKGYKWIRGSLTMFSSYFKNYKGAMEIQRTCSITLILHNK